MSRSPAVHGVDGTGWRLTSSAWAQVGALPAPPAAFILTPDGGYLAATDEEVLRSGDGGRTWEQLAPLGAGGGS